MVVLRAAVDLGSGLFRRQRRPRPLVEGVAHVPRRGVTAVIEIVTVIVAVVVIVTATVTVTVTATVTEVIGAIVIGDDDMSVMMSAMRGDGIMMLMLMIDAQYNRFPKVSLCSPIGVCNHSFFIEKVLAHELLHIPPHETSAAWERHMLLGAIPPRDQVERFLFPKEHKNIKRERCWIVALQPTMIWSSMMVGMMLWMTQLHCIQG